MRRLCRRLFSNDNYGVTQSDGGHRRASHGELRQMSDAREENVRVVVPAGLRVEQTPDGKSLSFRWVEAAHFGLLALSGMGAILLCGLVAALREERDGGLLAFTVIVVAAEVVIAWATCSGLLNRTIITIGRETLRVQHRPVPVVHRGRVYRRIDLRRVYVKQIAAPTSGDVSFPNSAAYRLYAETAQGEHVPLTRKHSGRLQPALGFVAWSANKWIEGRTRLEQ